MILINRNVSLLRLLFITPWLFVLLQLVLVNQSQHRFAALGQANIMMAISYLICSALIVLLINKSKTVPVGFMLARTSVFGPPMGAIGLWFGILIGLMVSSLLLFMRLHYILKNLMPEVGGSAMSQHSLPTPQGV